MTGALLVAVVLLLLNAYFVGAEFALVSARRDRVEPRAHAGSRRARLVVTAMGSLSTMLAACQLGITVASLGLGAVAEPAFAHLLEAPVRAIGLPEGAVHAVALLLALAVVVFCHMVLGEMVPKNIAMAGPEEAAMWLAPPLLYFARVTKPVLWSLGHIANACIRLAGIQPVDEVRSVYTAEELPAVIAESRRHHLLGPTEHQRLTQALSLPSRPASDVMRAWPDVVTVPGNDVGVLERAAVRTGLSRFPVVLAGGHGGEDGGEDAGQDRVAGYVHVLDAFEPLPDGTVPVYPLVVAHPDTPLSALLARMRAGRTHLAVVVGDDGLPAGLTSLDDVLTGFLV